MSKPEPRTVDQYHATPEFFKEEFANKVEKAMLAYLKDGWSWSVTCRKTHVERGVPYVIIDLVAKRDTLVFAKQDAFRKRQENKKWTK